MSILYEKKKLMILFFFSFTFFWYDFHVTLTKDRSHISKLRGHYKKKYMFIDFFYDASFSFIFFFYVHR